MWTEVTWAKYQRESLRDASDMTEAEWALIEPVLPPGKALGRPRTTDLREVTIASAEAWLFLASVQLLMRRLVRA